ncbi:MAG: M14 family zinc carboxypeptidase, partial [Candidatus Eisenbacteria bacterium]
MVRNLSSVLIVLALAAAVMTAQAQEPQPAYIKARVEFDSMAEFERFMKTPGLDIMKVKPGVGVTIVTDEAQLSEIESEGYGVVVEIEDMQDFYSRRIRGENFGEFHTYSETVEFLDDLHTNYPSIVSEKFSIATTYEGNDVWGIKVSDNHAVDETEPEIVFDGLHHAREPITVEVLMHYLEWLTGNYGTDPDAT